MLKLAHYFGLIRTDGSLEKSLMLGKPEAQEGASEDEMSGPLMQ